MTEQQYRIPKVNVPIVCHTEQGETLAGEIFLDMVSAEGYTVSQLLDYFNSEPAFFPIRSDSRTILLRKDSVIHVEVPQLMGQYVEQTSSFASKKEATIHLREIGPVTVRLILDLPNEYTRMLDLINIAERAFFPAIVNEAFALLSLRHIYKIEEIGHGET